MKYFYRLFLLAKVACRGLLYAFSCLLLFTLSARGQSLSLSVTNNAPNNCSVRVISVFVDGGSGSYAYFWSSQPASNVNLGNGPTISVSPAVATTYSVLVQDNQTSTTAQKSVLVSPLISGSFSVFIPNAIMEGGLWRVLDSNQGTGSLQAYRYELSIINASSNLVYSSSRTASSGTQGLVGGEISWNGRLNGTGAYVAAGNYFYDLRLINCSTNSLFRGTITFFRPLLLSIAPNPTQYQMDLSWEEAFSSAEIMPVQAEVQILSLTGEVLVSELVKQNPARLNLRSLPEGDYVVILRQAERQGRTRLQIRR